MKYCTLSCLPKNKISEFPNSVDPDVTAHYGLPHLDPHSFALCLWIFNMINLGQWSFLSFCRDKFWSPFLDALSWLITPYITLVKIKRNNNLKTSIFIQVPLVASSCLILSTTVGSLSAGNIITVRYGSISSSELHFSTPESRSCATE